MNLGQYCLPAVPCIGGFGRCTLIFVPLSLMNLGQYCLPAVPCIGGFGRCTLIRLRVDCALETSLRWSWLGETFENSARFDSFARGCGPYSIRIHVRVAPVVWPASRAAADG